MTGLSEDELWNVFQAVHATVFCMSMDYETTNLVMRMQEEAAELLESVCVEALQPHGASRRPTPQAAGPRRPSTATEPPPSKGGRP